MSLKAIGKPLVLANGKIIPLSIAYQVDNVLYLSGQLALDEKGKIVGSDIATQTTQVLKNIKNVLSQVGCGLNHVFKVTIWLTDASNFAVFNEVYGEAFKESPPARSAIRCDLLLPDALVEIEVMAYLKS